ncbi:MAG: pseudouridine-5'-phosphate glycosidase [Spirochaetaceae bacterium]|nr:MAG: pseudouridine-5'-phosphate glycosidase [Spirochaetaceae bacterium]
MKDLINTTAEVRDALSEGRPVVALESTIISHGMPYPTNRETAAAVEGIVREAGAVPATIAILDGKIRVGITAEELEFLSTSDTIKKACERDIPFIVAGKLCAATTVSATLAIAHAAGIRVFATGGIGAVGPDASTTMDISADLPALGRYECITVCSGAKAFMDVAGTLEFLETQGIPVVVYGTDRFPLFYSLDSGERVDWVMESAGEIARVFAIQVATLPGRGLLVANPIPSESAIPESEIRKAIDSALAYVAERKITGKAFTPAVLSRIAEITGGRSLTANIALIRNNARLAGEIAAALALQK